MLQSLIVTVVIVVAALSVLVLAAALSDLAAPRAVDRYVRIRCVLVGRKCHAMVLSSYAQGIVRRRVI